MKLIKISLLLIFSIGIVTFTPTNLSMTATNFTYDRISCSLDMTHCSSMSGSVISRYIYNSATENYDKTMEEFLSCGFCQYVANYMSDDGSYHVIFVNNDQF